MSVGIEHVQDGEVPETTAPCPVATSRLLHPAGSASRQSIGTEALSDIASGLAAAVATGPAQIAHRWIGPGDLVERRRLLSTAGYDAWLVRWAPGAVMEEHDHDGSVGVVHVVQGALVEYARDLDPASDPVRRELPAGATTAFGVDGRHRLANVGGTTISVQVYSPPIGGR
jgi:quercetin dioxygenase-like cupin family protein